MIPSTVSEILSKFQELKDRREEASRKNFESVKAEDARLKTNPRLKAKLLRKQAQAEEYFAKKDAEEEGLDYDRIRSLQWTAEQVSTWEAKETERKSRADIGFTDYNQAAFKKYNRLISNLNSEYIRNLEPDSEEAKSNLSEDVKQQLLVRAKFSKRRRFNPDEDVTYINQRNYRFNKKISRAYDQFTEEIKDNLERGTAL